VNPPKRAGPVILLALAFATPAAAQGPLRASPPVVKYGKWIAFGGAVAFGLLAQSEHHTADAAFQDLTDYCLDDFTRCDLGPNGHYLDPASERFYQTSLSHDRRAERWLLGGETLFLGATAGLLWELTRPRGLPANIPLQPVVERRPGGTLVGARFTF
jgi:hypothetical protein